MNSQLKEIMKARKISTRKLSSLTGLSLATIVKAGDTRVATCSLASLKKIASALQVQVCDLIDE